MVKIWVDDIRPKPCKCGIHFRSVNSVIGWLSAKAEEQKSEEILLDLDHDAGDYRSDGGDYIKILDFLEREDFIKKFPFLKISFRIHSMNPVGKENMRKIIKKNGWREVE